MRNLLFSLLLQLFALSAFSQTPEKGVYVVTFNDKGPTMEKTISAPVQYLSEQAIARRLKQNIPFDKTDLPVYGPYMEELLSTGVKILTRSRWLNCVVVESNIGNVGELKKIKGVKDVSLISNKNMSDQPEDNRKTQLIISEKTDNQVFKSTSSVIDYGASSGQINMIKGEYLHNLGYQGQGITIAVLDNGFSKVDVLPAFDSLWVNNQVLGTRDFVTPGANVFDPAGGIHGTAVLSTMAANLPGTIVGTAPKADYWLIHTEDNSGEAVIEEYYWVSGAEFADSVGADIINSSLGYTVFPNSPEYDHTYADMDGNTCVSTIGADMAAQKGILVVNSAGNSANSSWFYIGAPADGDSVFSIGAVNASGIVTSFSSRGPTYDGRIKPNVAAQGQGTAIYSWSASAPNGAVFYGDGTSFSSPIIAGMSACLWQSAPNKSNMDIINCLQNTASSAQSPDSLIGWGIPDYERAHSTLTSGIENDPVKDRLTAYPNPFTNLLTIVSPVTLSGSVTIEFITPQGISMLKQKYDQGQSFREFYIDNLEILPSGIYFLRVRSEKAILTTTCLKLK